MLTKCLLASFGKNTVIIRQLARPISLYTALESSPVLVSSSKDIYTNLAIENWLFNELRFKTSDKSLGPPSETSNRRVFDHPIVLIWTDEPSVVIGRHQNPWTEANVGFIERTGIKLARRHSGGGCVYHDENNINISVIGERKLFDKRQDNLKFLAKILKDNYSIECEPNKRHDLIHSKSGLKLSGSAAKLGKWNSYHHFTLLVDTNKVNMRDAIRQLQPELIHTNSTLSTRSSVINLKEIESEVDVNSVIANLVQAYTKFLQSKSQHRQTAGEKASVVSEDGEKLQRYRQELASWDWIYGMTPKFTMKKDLKLIEAGQMKEISLISCINKGLFEKFEIIGDLSRANPACALDHLIGQKFTYKDAVVNIVKGLQLDNSDSESIVKLLGSEQIFATLLLQMIDEANS